MADPVWLKVDTVICLAVQVGTVVLILRRARNGPNRMPVASRIRTMDSEDIKASLVRALVPHGTTHTHTMSPPSDRRLQYSVI